MQGRRGCIAWCMVDGFVLNGAGLNSIVLHWARFDMIVLYRTGFGRVSSV